MPAAAIAAASLSAVFNGSFAALSKVPRVARANVDPVIFNFYVCIGVCLSSWVSIPYLLLSAEMSLRFTAYGFLGGALFVFAVAFSFLAIPLVGLSMAQGVWCGSAIVVSFLWGSAGPAEISKPVVSVGLSVVAVLLLLGGVLGIVFCEALSQRLGLAGPVDSGSSQKQQLDGAEEASGREPVSGCFARRAQGFLCAVAVGLFGGSILVPLAFVPPELHGLGMMPSFGLGALVVGFAATMAYLALARARLDQAAALQEATVGTPMERADLPASSAPPAAPQSEEGAPTVIPAQALELEQCEAGVPPPKGSSARARTRIHWHVRETLWAGVVAGVLWNCGNHCQLYAMAYASPTLNYGVAYPILQCALLVSGLWGIFAFGEIRSRGAIAVFFTSSALLIVGAVLLGSFGPA